MVPIGVVVVVARVHVDVIAVVDDGRRMVMVVAAVRIDSVVAVSVAIAAESG
jgi:hypothetical protein